MTLAAGALALRVVEAHIDGVGAAPRAYAAACFVGALGLIVLADAPDEVTGVAGVLLVAGIADHVTRAVSVIWVNGRATSDVRATVHSFLSQAETVGEIFGGFALGALAQAAGIATTLVVAGALIACTGIMIIVARSQAGPDRASEPQ